MANFLTKVTQIKSPFRHKFSRNLRPHSPNTSTISLNVQRNKLKACKSDLLFDTILVGEEEPNQEKHILEGLHCSLAGCNPEGTIMVRDNLKTDIQGAPNAGFQATVWVNLHDLEDLPAGGATPDHTISNIGELPGFLQTLEVDLCQ